MTRTEVIEIAAGVAEAKGWQWIEPASATPHVSSDGSVTWEVFSNALAVGSKVRVTISDNTGEVLSKGYIPR